MVYRKKTTKKMTKRRVYKKRVGKYIKKGVRMVKSAAKLAYDVYKIKQMLNTEKKSISKSIDPNTWTNISLYNNIGVVPPTPGYVVLTPSMVFPTPAIGNNASERNGDLIKITGAYIRFHIRPQAFVVGALKGCIYMVSKKYDSCANTVATDIFDEDVFYSGGVITTSSKRNQYDFKKYRIMAKKYWSIPIESYSSQNSSLITRDVEIKLKLNHHVRFQKGTTNIEYGDWMFILVCNGGANNDQTGAQFKYTSTIYYVDN